MKVNQAGSQAVQNSEAAATRKASKAAATAESKEAKAAAAAASSSGAAKADISAKAKDMSRAKAAADAAPDVREEKIAELKRRIAEGRYKVDSGAVADRLVDEHLSSGIG